MKASGVKNPEEVTQKLIGQEIESFEDLLDQEPDMLQLLLFNVCVMKIGSANKLIKYCSKFRGATAAGDGGGDGGESGGGGGGEGGGGAAEVTEQAEAVSLEEKVEIPDGNAEDADEAIGEPAKSDMAKMLEGIQQLQDIVEEADSKVRLPATHTHTLTLFTARFIHPRMRPHTHG